MIAPVHRRSTVAWGWFAIKGPVAIVREIPAISFKDT